MSGLPQQLNLDFSSIQKGESPNMPPLNIANNTVSGTKKLLNLKGGKPDSTANQTTTGKRLLQNPTKLLTNIVNKSLNDDDSDVDLDDDLQQIPLGKEEAKTTPEPTAIEAPKLQISNLPALQDEENEDDQKASSKYSLLYDLLLTPEQYAENYESEWTYKSFIRQFAKNEAAQDGTLTSFNDDSDNNEEEEEEAYEEDISDEDEEEEEDDEI